MLALLLYMYKLRQIIWLILVLIGTIKSIMALQSLSITSTTFEGFDVYVCDLLISLLIFSLGSIQTLIINIQNVKF